ncbi:MAG: DUF4270 family protein [Flavobacteriaceae bacterium]
MYFLRMFINRVTILLALSLILFSCDKEYHAAGSELLLSTALKSKTFEAPVYSYQSKVNYFQTDGLPLAQLGKINLSGLGTTEANITAKLVVSQNPVFGRFTQKKEDEGDDDNSAVIDEKETVTQVYLEIPFFNNTDDKDGDGVIDALDLDPNDRDSDTDGDGLSDFAETNNNLNPLSEDSDGDGILDDVDQDNKTYDNENKIYEIDSIYGNRNARFDLKVYELKYFLSKYDPATEFQTQSKFFSNTDYFEKGFYGETLHDDSYQLNFEELRFNHKEDDPDTEDVDERETVETRLTPRIRVPLDKAFFQEKILDQEGSSVFSNDDNFSRHLRGLIIKTENFDDDLYMLLDISNARIKVEYEYDEVDTNGTADNTDDDTTEKKSKTFLLNFGLNFNTIRNNNSNTTFDQEVIAGQNEKASQHIYLSGNGLFSTLKLFENQDGQGKQTLKDLRDNNWVINEANLVLYVDQDQYSLFDRSQFPDRLYLYKYDYGVPLTDFSIDNSVNNEVRNRNKFIYGGILELDDANRPYRYKFRITDHINRLITKDSTNVRLGLVPSNGLNFINSRRAETVNQEMINYPITAVLNPRGVILHGSESENHPEGGLKLEIFYTEY